jgi:hypothetical protein
LPCIGQEATHSPWWRLLLLLWRLLLLHLQQVQRQ